MSNVFYCSQTRSLVSDLNFLMYRTHASNINYIQLLLNALNVECVLSQPNQNISILVQSLNGLNLTTFCKFNYIWSITLSTVYPPPCRAGSSSWMALWYGTVSHWLSGHFLEYSPRNSFSNLKGHYLAALRLGAYLSSPT